jgi:protein involved in polysaccharide export with SLBB domain
LTLEELKQEINLRYDRIVGGLEVEPTLEQQAPHNIFVLGEVVSPGRYNLDNTPTTVLGAMAMAGGHIPGANLRQVVIFRRGEQFELLSTLLDLRGAILGREAHPCDEIWIRDNDVIIVPAAPIRLFNNFVRQVFTEGIYGIYPVSFNYLLNRDGGGTNF